MSKPVVEGCELEIEGADTGSAQFTTPASQHEKIDGNGIYSGPQTVSVSNYRGGTIKDNPATGTVVVTPGAGIGVMNPSNQTMYVGGKFVITDDDTCQVTVSALLSVYGEETTGVETVTVKISDAGQDTTDIS